MVGGQGQMCDKTCTEACQARKAIIGPAVDQSVAHEAVGVKPATLIPKEIPLIEKNPILQIKISPKHIPNEQKDDDDADYKQISEEPNEEDSDAKRFATADELEKGKLPPKEILSLPMCKVSSDRHEPNVTLWIAQNHTAGIPASVLYIKNLAKDVVPEDLYFIFGSLFGSIDAAKSSLNGKLMQEGRMMGQAFVTFPSAELVYSSTDEG
ncbi:hypothetical protein PTKIN_Ptkin01aG0365800 [Pterospermum kingtungense]